MSARFSWSYILRKKGIITKNGIVAGMLSGILVCAISMQFNSVVPFVIWGCLASGIAMIVFSKLDKTNPVYLEKIRSRYVKDSVPRENCLYPDAHFYCRVEENLAEADRLIETACANGATLLILPETFTTGSAF